MLRRFVERQGGRDVLDEARVRRRLGRLYFSAAKHYFKARCYAQARIAVQDAHRYLRTPRTVALGWLSRVLAPLTRARDADVPRL